MKNILLIIDPQNDFITGSLTVPGALEAMQRLTQALPRMELQGIYTTSDEHPLHHCSFVEQGGEWPPHCVQGSIGAEIFAPLMGAITDYCKQHTIEHHHLPKGMKQDQDEYSSFAHQVPAAFAEAAKIYVAGIAGDVCVHTSVSDLIAHGYGSRLVLLTEACPSLDGGNKLHFLITTKQLQESALPQ